MRSLSSIYADAVSKKCQSDKGDVHSYIEVYEELLAPYRNAKKMLEIGVFKGDSIRMWEQYFDQAEVYGVDLCDRPHGGLGDLRPMIAEGTHRIILMNACDPEQVERNFSGQKFEVIIEDASHTLADQLRIYENLRDHMSPNGIYIIEDIAFIDTDRAAFENIGARIIDRRNIKNRFDDVLAVIYRAQ